MESLVPPTDQTVQELPRQLKHNSKTPQDKQRLLPRRVYLRDHVTHATIYPVFPPAQLSGSLISFLHHELNKEILQGDTYPLEQAMSLEQFAGYWFGSGNFTAVIIKGKQDQHGELTTERDWSQLCLGSFYIKPNYPGRSSHICNAGFLVSSSVRGRGVGKLLAEAYLDYAPKLGYTYSLFDLVYETNVPAIKIWESLGFKRIGQVKGAGRLRSWPGQAVDALIFGRDLKDDEDYVSEERFDKIRFYLEKGKYPPTADRSEKSRLRSAATHYRIEGGKLMLKEKEVVSDGQRQYEIAKRIHDGQHGGINKTTAQIAERYHWVRIKETVSLVIRNCDECKENVKTSTSGRGERYSSSRSMSEAPPQQQPSPPPQQQQQQHHQQQSQQLQQQQQTQQQMQQTMQMVDIPRQMQQQLQQQYSQGAPVQSQMQSARLNDTISIQHPLILPHQQAEHARIAQVAVEMDIPVDPAMMEGVHHHHIHSQDMQQFAPVASMHAIQQALHGQSDANQHVAAAMARAALTQEGTIDKDHTHLMERLMEEMKKEAGLDIE